MREAAKKFCLVARPLRPNLPPPPSSLMATFLGDFSPASKKVIFPSGQTLTLGAGPLEERTFFAASLSEL